MKTLMLSTLTWLLLITGSMAAAEDTVIEFTGGDIQFPVRPTVYRESQWPRVVTFPDCTTISVRQDFASDDLLAEIQGNTLRLMLLKPTFSTPVYVVGDNGTIYPLVVFAAKSNEEPPNQVSIVDVRSREAAKSGKGPAGPEPLDSQVIRLVKHIYGFKPQAGVTESVDLDQDELKKGVRKVGRRIFETDNFQIMSIRVARLRDVVCHTCIITYRGEKDSVFFNFQEYVVPNEIAKVPRTIDVIDPKFPGMILKRGVPRVLYIFSQAKD